ncbi:hypothetical protein EUX98_g7167 [Antrodiella citrinella]|uniref:Rhodanese domain-containing protein n=1 Tax=Antrodiella citrinella TaxID=2447956 RepID=A0A4S4MPP2_9APHY|nr:hypothetical protein EUX98_g7167 [Antrodiella citrinella]
MQRIALSRVSTLARTTGLHSTVLRSAKPVAWRGVRLESSTAIDEQKAARRAALETRDDKQRDWDAKILSYEDLKPRTQQPSSDSYLIDVREPDEVLQGSIPSSVNLPLSVLGKSLHLKPAEFQEKFGFPLPKKNQEVVFYCRSGVRSASACDVAKRNGWTKCVILTLQCTNTDEIASVMNYKGSWLEWLEKEGKPAT